MKVVESITVEELKKMAQNMFGELVKADVDVAKKVMIVDMPMHYDGEVYMLEHGSKQKDLWGINLHPTDFGSDDFIEFDSMINIRPSQGNPSKDVLDQTVRTQIITIVDGVVHE